MFNPSILFFYGNIGKHETFSNPDLIVAEARRLVFRKDLAKIRFGTVGSGLDLFREVWLQEEHVFAARLHQHSCLPDAPQAHCQCSCRNAPTKHMLQDHEVDVLVVDGMEFSSAATAHHRWEE